MNDGKGECDVTQPNTNPSSPQPESRPVPPTPNPIDLEQRRRLVRAVVAGVPVVTLLSARAAFAAPGSYTPMGGDTVITSAGGTKFVIQGSIHRIVETP